MNKLCRITTIATRENQTQIAGVVATLSQKALEIKVREIKQQTLRPQIDMFGNGNGSAKPGKGVRAHGPGINRDIKLMQILSDEMKEKYGTKCSVPKCNHPATQFHHEKPFAKFKTHDPIHIKPLCRGHHELQHK